MVRPLRQPARAGGRIFPSLRGYRRSWLATDLGAAAALLALAIPEQLATSRLAGMPPITGYVAFIAGTVLFAAFGANPRMSVGADSTIAPLFAVGVASVAATGSAHYTALVAVLAIVVGVLVALVGVLRLGWVAQFMSTPIISGFMGGIAVIIVIHQLPEFLGIPDQAGSSVRKVADIATHLGDTNAASVILGLAVITVVALGRAINPRLPMMLIALVGVTAAVPLFGLTDRGVAVLGEVTSSLPRVGFGGVPWSSVPSVLPLAAVVALVVLSQTAATTRAFPTDRYRTDVDRDFVGVGAANVVAGLAGSFAVDASPPRTGVVAGARGHSQLTGLVAAAVLAALIPAADVLRDVPLAGLAAVLLVVAARIAPVRELIAIARFDRFEFALALVTLLTVALVGVQQGIGLAVALAILDRTRLAARSQLHALGRIPDTTSWVPLTAAAVTVETPDVLVLMFATPLWYGNAERFEEAVEAAVAAEDPPPRLVILDVVGMTDIDFTGAEALGRVSDQLRAAGTALALARTGNRLRLGLEESGLLTRIGPENLYDSVDEAVASDRDAG